MPDLHTGWTELVQQYHTETITKTTDLLKDRQNHIIQNMAVKLIKLIFSLLSKKLQFGFTQYS